MKDIDKIKQLIFSNEQYNIDLGFQLMKGLGYSDFLIRNWIVEQGILYTQDTNVPDGLEFYGPFSIYGKLKRDVEYYAKIPVTLKGLIGEHCKFEKGVYNAKLNDKGKLIDVTLFVKDVHNRWEGCALCYNENIDPVTYNDLLIIYKRK